jgi:dTDP-4-dehydrorhamnose reductase
MLRLAAERDELRVVADQHGAPTYAPDLAGALLGIAAQVRGAAAGDARFGIYHLANAGTASWADVAEATLRASVPHGGRLVPVRRIATADYPTPARRAANSRLDCARIAATFGVTLPAWEPAVARCVAAIMR